MFSDQFVNAIIRRSVSILASRCNSCSRPTV